MMLHIVLHLEENILSVCGQYASVVDMELLEDEDVAEISASMTRMEAKREAKPRIPTCCLRQHFSLPESPTVAVGLPLVGGCVLHRFLCRVAHRHGLNAVRFLTSYPAIGIFLAACRDHCGRAPCAKRHQA